MNTILENSLQLQGNNIQYHEPTGTGRKGGGPRGKVTDFSRYARRNMNRLQTSIDLKEVKRRGDFIEFISPTLPQECWPNERGAYMALRQHMGWLKDSKGVKSVIWKKEYGEKNGSLHYHLEVYGPRLYEIKEELQKHWTECVKNHCGYNKGPVIYHVSKDDGRDPEIRQKYIGKYTSKFTYKNAPSEVPVAGDSATAEDTETGSTDARTLFKAHSVGEEPPEVAGKEAKAESTGDYTGSSFWGVWGRKDLPMAQIVVHKTISWDINRRIAMQVRRDFMKLYKAWKYKALLKEHNSRDLAKQHLKWWMKTRSYTFLKSGKGYMLMGDNNELQRIFDNVCQQERCVRLSDTDLFLSKCLAA